VDGGYRYPRHGGLAVIAGVSVVMTIFPALFAAVLVLGTHVAVEALWPQRLFGTRLLARVLNPFLLVGWLGAVAALFLLSICFGVLALFFTVLPGQP
jgi:hypothetical protein